MVGLNFSPIRAPPINETQKNIMSINNNATAQKPRNDKLSQAVPPIIDKIIRP